MALFKRTRTPIPVELTLKKMKFRLDETAKKRIDVLVIKADQYALSLGADWNLENTQVGRQMKDLYFQLEGKRFVKPDPSA